jgi:hypothetical protein
MTTTERSGAPKKTRATSTGSPVQQGRAAGTTEGIPERSVSISHVGAWRLRSWPGRVVTCALRARQTKPALDREVEREDRRPPATWNVRDRQARPWTRTPARFGVLGTRSPPWRTSSAELSRSLEADNDEKSCHRSHATERGASRLLENRSPSKDGSAWPQRTSGDTTREPGNTGKASAPSARHPRCFH